MTKFTGHKLKLDEQKIETPSVFTIRYRWISIPLSGADVPCKYLRSTLGERFVIFRDPVVDGIPVHARREDSRFLVTWTGDVQNLRHFE